MEGDNSNRTRLQTRRTFIKAATASGGAAALAGCVGEYRIFGSDEDAVRVGENRGNGIQSAEILLAQEFGWDEEEGVEFDTQTYGIGVDIMQGIAAGEIHYGIDGASWAFLVTASRGGDIFVPSQNWTFEPISFITPDHITEWSDLEGQTIAQIEGSIMDYLLYSQLEEQEGISVDDVEIVNIGAASDQVAALSRGEIQGAWLWTRFMWQLLEEEEGFHALVEGPEVAPETIQSWGVLTMSRSWAEDNLETAASALRVTERAIDFINEETEEAAEIIAEEWDTNAEEELRTVESGIDHYVGLYADHFDHWREMKQWGAENGHMDDFDLDEFIYTEPAEEAFPDKVEM